MPWGLAALALAVLGVGAAAIAVRAWVSSDVSPQPGELAAEPKPANRKWTPFTVDMLHKDRPGETAPAPIPEPPPAPRSQSPVISPAQRATPQDDDEPDIYAACDSLPDEESEACQDKIDDRIAELEEACDKWGEGEEYQDCIDAADRAEEYEPKK